MAVLAPNLSLVGFINLAVKLTAYDDSSPSNNPQRRSPDWGRTVFGLAIDASPSYDVRVPALTTSTVFDGTRTLTINSLTELEISINSVDPNRYRLEWTETGAAPGFRTARTVPVAGQVLDFELQSNQTLVVTASGTPFGTVQVGDSVLLIGVGTDDGAGDFDELNVGEWVVLSASSGTLTLRRPPGTTFSGATQLDVTIADDYQVQAYSAAGVQVGDVLDITAGFVASSRHAYDVVFVTARRIDFVSTSPLAAEVAVPGVAGITIYSEAKDVVYVEADQEVALRVNGDSTDHVRVQPRIPGDPDGRGMFLVTGPVFSLVVSNRSEVEARVLALTAELDA